MSEAIDAIRDERNHWIGEAKKFERCWKYAEESNRDWIKRRNEERERAERAEAELAALRERVRGMVEQATEAAYGAIATEQMLTILPTKHGAKVPPHWRAQAEARATLTVADLRDLLDDDTTGAASGEGEK